jgi:RNase adaptor protein for sRNA GlmZ degradation
MGNDRGGAPPIVLSAERVRRGVVGGPSEWTPVEKLQAEVGRLAVAVGALPGSQVDALRVRSVAGVVAQLAGEVADESTSVHEVHDTVEPSRVLVTSFGYLHGGPPLFTDIIVDLRYIIRDPITFPELTGLDPRVKEHVLAAPASRVILDGLVRLVRGFVMGRGDDGSMVHVAVGCSGGRHRSVVLAAELAAELERVGVCVDVQHTDVRKPVVTR